MLMILVALHAAVRLDSGETRAAYRSWGLLEVQASAEHPPLQGPFDLWAGDWWRIPLGGLHQPGWWQFLMVGVVAWWLGRLLEWRIPWPLYVGFLLGAITVSTLPRWLWAGQVPMWVVGNDAITGLSGVVLAQFGFLLMLRRNDRELARQFGEGAILLGIMVGLGSLAGSTVGLLTRVDQLAQLSGFGYGLVWGLIFSCTPVVKWGFVVVWLGLHAVLWPVFNRLMHPVNHANYHWWLALEASDASEKIAEYLTCLKLDPMLQQVWLELAELQWQSEQPLAAWRTLMNASKHHPQFVGQGQLSQQIWASLTTDRQRESAWLETERQAADNRSDWLGRLLSPQQASEFFLKQNQPLDAWLSLVRHISTLPKPNPVNQNNPNILEAHRLAMEIWQNFPEQSQRLDALLLLDQELDADRRSWHLALIPPRDLILHYQSLGENLWAWELLVGELQNNPAFASQGKQLAREIWLALPTELRRERARKILMDRYGVAGWQWQLELGILTEESQKKYRLDQSIQLPADLNKADLPVMVDPDDPSSAVFGSSL